MIDPIKYSVKAMAHTDQYSMHKYYARRPYNVFRNLIDHYTEEGDTVLDVFCGGGVTIFESLFLNRKVVGVDLNPLASFITEMQVKQIDIHRLETLFNDFMTKVKNEYSHLYTYTLDNQEYEIEWMEWAYEVLCPICGSKIVLLEQNKALNASGKPKNGYYVCPNRECKCSVKEVGVKRTDCKAYSSKPVKAKLRSIKDNESFLHIITEDEAQKIKSSEYSHYINKEMIVPDAKVPDNWDRTLEDKLPEKGVSNFSDLFTKRNYILNVIIYNEILNMRDYVYEDYIDCLFFAFSASLRYTNNMTRVTEKWENGNPTSMDKHAYWLPNEYVETNVFDKLNNRMKAVLKGLSYTDQTLRYKFEKVDSFTQLEQPHKYMVLNQSSSSLPIPDKSINAVITDPPYGSNVQYSELSSIWNVWLQSYKNLTSFIYNTEEAVMNRKKNFEGSKDIHHYEEMLFKVFSECHRVLKDDGYLVFTFNNKDLKVWVALLKATLRAGFIIPKHGVIYQDFIQSYKNTAHLKYSGNVHGDFIYSFCKGVHPINHELENIEPLPYIESHISRHLDDLFMEKESYTTTELYEEIFYDLINVLCDFIVINLNADDNWLVSLEKHSSEYIDNLLKRDLIFKDNQWYKKTEELYAGFSTGDRFE